MCIENLFVDLRSSLRKASPELDLQILLDTKRSLGAVVKFLDSLSATSLLIVCLGSLFRLLLFVNL
jgi:hypothetical protein